MSSASAAVSDLNATTTITTNSGNKGTNVQVVVRCRPLNGEERKSSQPSVAMCEPETKSVKIAYGPMGKKIQKSFNFDKVFGVYSRQEEVFDQVVRPIVEETLAGFNCTIFAYGQTGTGKTHTMEGDIHSKEDAGIVPRAVNAILEQLEATGVEFTIRVSFLELYNEELQDLLNISGDKKLKLCEDVKKGVVCQNLEEIAVLNANDIFEILQRGIQQRQTAATLCNKNSSRSHSIFTMKIMIKEYNIEGEEVIRNGQLNLVDLAGSECIGRSGAKNDRAREAGSINQSLLTLGRVITALVDHHPHVPYRDSKLTRLLQESLGGKAKTCIIATFSPAQAAVEETLSTLDYAHRAKNIKNQPTVNQKLTKKVIMKEYFAEIETLRNQLVATREKNGVYLAPEDYYAMESKIATQEAQLTECEGALKQRLEEVKVLKEAQEALNVDLSFTKHELHRVSEELTASEAAKQVAQEHSTDVYRVWQSTEHVVQEQKKQETILLQAGKNLKQQLSSAGRNVTSLLSKVSSLENAEMRRLQKTETFCQSLDQQHDGLLSRLRALQQDAQSMQHHASAQWQQLLQEAQKTQEKLSDVVSQQVTTMVSNKEKHVQSQQQEMTAMEKQLWNQQVHLNQQLSQMQQAMDSWMSSAMITLSSSQEQLQEQIQTITELAQDMKGTQQSIKHQTSQFMKQQATMSQEITGQFDDFVARLQDEMTQLHRDQAQSREAQQQLLTQKTAKIMSTMQTLLAEILSEQSSAFSAQSDRWNVAQQTHMHLLQEGKAKVVEKGLQQGMQPLVHSFASQLTETMTKQDKLMQQKTHSVTSMTQQVISQQVNMQEMVGQKRKFLSSSIQELDEAQESEVKRHCSTLAQLKNSLVSDHQVFASDMGNLDGRVQDTLSTFFDRDLPEQQQTIQDSFSTFFTRQDASFQQQQDSTTETQTLAQGFSQETRQSVTRCSGNTPRKALVVISPTLLRTRPAHLIRKEYLISHGPSISYEAVASHMPTLIPSVTTAGGSDMLGDEDYDVHAAVVQEEENLATVLDMVVDTSVEEKEEVIVDEPTVFVEEVIAAPALSAKVSTSRGSIRNNSNSGSSNKLKLDLIEPEMMVGLMDSENIPPNNNHNHGNNSTCSSAVATPSNVSTKSKLPMTRATRTAKTTTGADVGVSSRPTRSNSAFFHSDN